MKDVNGFRIVSSLRELCIKEQWFNAGSCEQYDTMFDVAKKVVNYEANNAKIVDFTFDDLVTIIWICTADVTLADHKEIYKKLVEWKKQMLSEAKELNEDV